MAEKKRSAELDELISSLQNATYTPKTQDELKQQAQNRYQSHYDQQKLSAQQEYERNAAALEKQLAGLDATYAKQREQSEKAYAQAYSQADRNLLAKGMQRSSYGAQVLANIQQSGNEALQDIADAEAAHRQGIEGDQALLAQQLAAQIKQYDSAQAADILAYMDELEAREYDRGQAANQYNNQLATQIYEYLMAEKQNDAEADRWQKEFDAALQQQITDNERWQKEFEFTQQQHAAAQDQWQKEYDLTQQQQQAARDQWQKEYDLAVQKQNTANEQWQKEFDFAQKQYEEGKKGSSGGYYNTSSTGGDVKNQPTDQGLFDILGIANKNRLNAIHTGKVNVDKPIDVSALGPSVPSSYTPYQVYDKDLASSGLSELEVALRQKLARSSKNKSSTSNVKTDAVTY